MIVADTKALTLPGLGKEKDGRSHGRQNDLLWTRQTANSVALGKSLRHYSPHTYPNPTISQLILKLLINRLILFVTLMFAHYLMYSRHFFC